MRWMPKTRRARRLVGVGAVWALVLLLAPGLLTRGAEPSGPAYPDLPVLSKSRADDELGLVVSLLSGSGARVYCWSNADWEQKRDSWHRRPWSGPWGAYVTSDPVVTVNLAPNECMTLNALMTAEGPVWLDEHSPAFAWSVHVLAHEAVHAAGHQDETKAACWGVQLTAKAAVELGRTLREGRYLGELAWKRWYPLAPPSYRSPDCRDGGRLDLRPKSHIWP